MPGQAIDRIALSVGVTAHRDLVASEVPGIEQRVREFFSALQGAYPDLPLQLLSPLAEGGDQLAARVAISMGIPFIAILPMSLPEYEQDFGDSDSLQRFRKLLDQAEHTIILPPVDQSTQSGAVEDERTLQYAQLGVFISDHSHVLLALWDGKPGDLMAGTGAVVRYHLTAVMDGFEGDPTPGGLLADNENDLVHHIVCSRNRLSGMPGDGLAPLGLPPAGKPGSLQWREAVLGHAGQPVTRTDDVVHQVIFVVGQQAGR